MRIKEAEKLMGRVVTVHAVLSRRAEYAKGFSKRIHWIPMKYEPRAGWVVGVRTVYDGHIIPGGFEDPSEWIPQSPGHRVLQVVFTPFTKPVLVPLDGYVLGGTPDHRDLGGRWNETDKAEMRKIAKQMPRDSKGRFLPESSRR